MFLNNTFHLSYCSNIHPGENWERTFLSLKENLPKIKAKLAPNNAFGIGLRLSNLASEELAENNNLQDFKYWLNETDCYVFTMNGFPYGNFHGERVKDQVHTPDWSTPERLDYTLRLFGQLRELPTNGLEGGISTSPISYKHWFEGDLEIQKTLEKGAAQMALVAARLFEIQKETGKYLHLDVEPEPDGLLENTSEVLNYYQNYLVPAAITVFGEMGINANEAEKLVKKYITVCYDVCHFALAYEEPEDTFEQLNNAGIKIGKIQISAALKILYNEKGQDELWEALAAFDEPTYLHQVTELIDDKVETHSDLPNVLSKKERFSELRAHFHVPVFLNEFGLLESTQDQIIKTLNYLNENQSLTRHLEVETYTWEVLPENLKIPLINSIARELNWVKAHL